MKPSQGIQLSPTEMRLIQAYRSVDDYSQEFLLRLTQSTAEDSMFKRQQEKRPILRLIAGGGK
jgi:hypothetical protein